MLDPEDDLRDDGADASASRAFISASGCGEDSCTGEGEREVLSVVGDVM